MKPIEVFYHLYIPGDLRATTWAWWVDQQMGLLRDSKLADIAPVYACITMPRYWNQIHGIPLTMNQQKHIFASFEDKVREYIALRYPFVNILEVRDTGEPNLYEGQTLKALWEKCKESEEEKYILYTHSKGVISASAAVANWREVLNHFCIKEWPTCVRLLGDAETVGLKDIASKEFTFSGNFWWARSSHIKRLPNPQETHTYLGTEKFHPGGASYRYGLEYWIRTYQPTAQYIFDTGANHFDNYYFLENVLGKK